MKNYQEIIKENIGDFNDAEQLTDFLDNYTNEQGDDVREQEDNISEYADGLVPIYYSDQLKEWTEKHDAQGMAEEMGILEDTKDPYKIMEADLYCYYDQQLREDYNKLIELMDEQEADGENNNEVKDEVKDEA